MTSLHNQLDAAVAIDPGAVADNAALEAELLDLHRTIYELGGTPSFLFTSPAYVHHINNMAFAAGRERDIGNDKTVVNVVDLYVSSFGELTVVMDRHMDNCYFLLDFNYLATPVLRTTADWPLAKVGDSERRQVLRESTFAVLNSESCGMLDGLEAAFPFT